MNARITMLLAIALAAGGCAAQGRPFEPATAPPRDAIIYVYRPYGFFGSAIHPAVRCGQESVEIAPGAYHAFVVPPGRITCSAGTETSDEVEIDAEPRIYYLREQIELGALIGRPQLNPIDTDEAQSEIQTCCVQQP
jgi:hypothetical protein